MLRVEQRDKSDRVNRRKEVYLKDHEVIKTRHQCGKKKTYTSRAGEKTNKRDKVSVWPMTKLNIRRAQGSLR